MRVGIVSKSFNRGQPIVGRQLRSAVDELGHESYVLAKPRREKGPMSGALERTGVWDQPGVTEATRFETPLEEYVDWVRTNGIDAILCDQNYQFEEMAELRARGVKVIGRFVWEHFTREHLGPAVESYDVIYSVTQAEQQRYALWGVETPRVPWGIHPELLVAAEGGDRGKFRPKSPSEGGASADPRPQQPPEVTCLFPGGFIGHRKPLGPVVEAFARTTNERLRLMVKAQVERDSLSELMPLIESDPRIELRLGDDPWQEHLATIADCDVSVTPSRWEGLGLPLYEAMAFGMPVITNDDPPMNEVVEDRVNGLLVPSHEDGFARSGIPAKRPDPEALTEAIERIADDGLRAELTAGAVAARDRLSWDRTVAALGELLER